MTKNSSVCTNSVIALYMYISYSIQVFHSPDVPVLGYSKWLPWCQNIADAREASHPTYRRLHLVSTDLIQYLCSFLFSLS